MLRIILGVVAGVLAVLLTVGAIEYLAHLLFPLPSDSAPIPAGIQLLVLLAYFLGALVGGVIAARISERSWTAWLIAALVAAGAVWSMFLIPHPQWMQVAAVIAPLLGGWAARHLAASRLARPRTSDATDAAV
jgi:predicted MFS family arabinose efflux permease